jgi:hypothetical protein
VDRYPCDAKYIEALGPAVFNFGILENSITGIIERLEQGYLNKYVSQKKTAGKVAKDFAQAIGRAQGHVAAAELTDIYNTFVGLKDRRDKLLHANPGIAADGAQQMFYGAGSIAWDLEAVREAAMLALPESRGAPKVTCSLSGDPAPGKTPVRARRRVGLTRGGRLQHSRF